VSASHTLRVALILFPVVDLSLRERKELAPHIQKDLVHPVNGRTVEVECGAKVQTYTVLKSVRGEGDCSSRL